MHEREMQTDEALAIARDRSVGMVKRLEALRSVEVNDPEAGEMADKNLCRDHLQNDTREIRVIKCEEISAIRNPHQDGLLIHLT